MVQMASGIFPPGLLYSRFITSREEKKSSKLLMLWHVANLEKTTCKSTMSYSWTDNLFQCINRCLVLNFSLALHIQNTTDQFWKYLREVPFFLKNTFVSTIIQTKDMINAEFSYCTAAFTFKFYLHHTDHGLAFDLSRVS